MALLLDGAWCEADDLQAYDGSATTVVAEEGIDLAAKMALSEQWITDRVDAYMRWESTLTGANAVVDEALKRWHLSNVLGMVYRDASFSQANDRFEKKWKAFEQDASRRKAEYFQAGVPFTGNPVRKPGPPAVIVIVGDQPATAYSVVVTRVDGGGREGAPSEVAAVEAAAGNGIIVTAAGLAPSDRWNVYATDSDGPLCRQNDEPLASSVLWSLPAGGLTVGAQAGTGQVADGRVRQRRILPRG